jgi:hypothetical protein
MKTKKIKTRLSDDQPPVFPEMLGRIKQSAHYFFIRVDRLM